jgi:electron transfer flavoprotein beta subunit
VGVTQAVVGVALKWAPRRAVVDPLTGVPVGDAIDFGLSAADEAALEVGLRIAETLGIGVRAVTVGPADAVAALHGALAAGAEQAIHVLTSASLDAGSPPSCRRTSRELAQAFQGCAFVVCGDASEDGGTGSVPALLAAKVGAMQGLGLIRVVPRHDGTVEAERRLDRGARERIVLTTPAVLSVEGSAARLRRAGLGAVVGSQGRPVVVRPVDEADGGAPSSYVPYRPRTRVVQAPGAGLPPDARIRAILGVDADREPARVVRAEPAYAAREIVDQLRRWGYL